MIIFNFKFRDMKKQVLMMAALALALGGCSKTETTEVAQGGKIGFAGSGVNNITKADLTPDNFTAFKVYGGHDATDLFNGTVVSKGSGADWTYENTQYWVDGNWKFGAYAPETSGVSASWSYDNGLILTVNSDNANQNDVVYASATAELGEGAAETYTTVVALQFNHLLSKVEFRFQKGNSIAAQQVELSDFQVTGITSSGVWTAGVLGNTSKTSNYTAFLEESAIEESGLTAGPFYVIPQTVGSFAITFNAKVTQNGEVIAEGTVNGTVPTGDITQWTANYVYRYTATLEMDNIEPTDPEKPNANPIEFVGTVNGWESNITEGNVNLTENE